MNFKDFKKMQIITVVVSLLGLVLILRDFIHYNSNISVTFYIGWILLIGAIITDYKYKRCPHCDHYLKEGPNKNSYCPNCGKKIFE